MGSSSLKRKALSTHEKLFARVAIRRRRVTKQAIRHVLRESPDCPDHLAELLVSSGQLKADRLAGLIEALQPALRDGAQRAAAEQEDDWVRRTLLKKQRLKAEPIDRCLTLQRDEMERDGYRTLGCYLVREGYIAPQEYFGLVQQMARRHERAVVFCAFCGTRYRISRAKLGHRLRCKACKQPFRAELDDEGTSPELAGETVQLDEVASLIAELRDSGGVAKAEAAAGGGDNGRPKHRSRENAVDELDQDTPPVDEPGRPHAPAPPADGAGRSNVRARRASEPEEAPRPSRRKREAAADDEPKAASPPRRGADTVARTQKQRGRLGAPRDRTRKGRDRGRAPAQDEPDLIPLDPKGREPALLRTAEEHLLDLQESDDDRPGPIGLRGGSNRGRKPDPGAPVPHADSSAETRPLAASDDDESSSDDDLLERPVERVIDDYEIQSEIARGGMGIVYRARQISLDRIVALKVLKDPDMASRAALKRFLREAQAAAKLTHPNIVTVYEVKVHGASPFFSMDLIEGDPLDKLLGDKRLPVRRGVEILIGVASGLHFSHTQGIIHRDIKPANIIVGKDGIPRITDFGLAKAVSAQGRLTRSGHPIGTPYYMSPEQARGDRAAMTARTDVYSLGVILYELLAGRVPFVGRSNQNIYFKIEREEPRSPRAINPRSPRDLEVIALKAISKQPADRYTSAEEMAEELQRWLDGESIQTRPPSPVIRIGRWLYRNRVATLAALCAGLIVGGGAYVFSQRGQQPPPKPPPDHAGPPTPGPRPVDKTRVVRSQQLLEQGRLGEALDLLDAHLRERPDDPDAYFVRARVYFFLRNHESAKRDLLRYLERHPRNDEALFIAAANLHRLGRAREAVSELQAAVSRAKTSRAKAIRELYLAAALFDTGAKPAALEACERALQLDTTLTNARLSTAWIFLDSGDYKRAAEAAEQVLKDRPWDVHARILNGAALYRDKDFRRAHARFLELEAFRVQPSAQIKQLRAHELFHDGPVIGEGLNIQTIPTAQLKGIAGKILRHWMRRAMTGQPPDSDEIFGIAREVTSTFAYVHYQWREGQKQYYQAQLIAPAEDSKARIDEFASELERSAQMWQGNAAMQKGFTLMRAALEYINNGIDYYIALSQIALEQSDHAELTLDSLLGRVPKMSAARLARARLALGERQYASVIELTGLLLTERPDWAATYQIRAAALWQQKRTKDANAILRRGIQRIPRFYDLHVALGRQLLVAGRTADAEKSLRNALFLEPAQPELYKQLAKLKH